MNVQTEIKELVLSFFDIIGSHMSYNAGIYNISIPQEYHNHFRSNMLVITFEKEIASTHNCELVIAGSRILSTVMKICMNKAPISFKKISADHNQTILRYHFFVNFSATHDMSNLTFVDIDIDTCQPVTLAHNTKYDDVFMDMNLDLGNITSSYDAALDELSKRYDHIKTKFISDANDEFHKDFGFFMHKYDSQIRDLDESINKKEHQYDNLEKIKRYRFECIKKIKELECEKINLTQTLQAKHQIHLTYNLIACEIIQICV